MLHANPGDPGDELGDGLGDGSVVEFRVDGRDLGPRQLWALNLQGFGVDSSDYFDESARLAATFGWRVVTPSLPCLGSLGEIARRLARLLDELDVEHAVLLGHSMGAAVGTQLAIDHPDRALGIVVRAGCVTPAWSAWDPQRLAAGIVEVSDFLLSGRPFAWLTELQRVAMSWCRPEARAVAHSLFRVDLRAGLGALRDAGVPVLGVWGAQDGLVPRQAATELAEAAGAEIVTVQGGHHWMVLRPGTQGRVLAREPAGARFLDRVHARAIELCGRTVEATPLPEVIPLHAEPERALRSPARLAGRT